MVSKMKFEDMELSETQAEIKALRHSERLREKVIEKEGLSKRFVGVPGMNSICKALCNESGVESKFGAGIGRVEWLDDEKLWSLTGVNGQNLRHFKGLVASDKNIVSTRITEVTGRLPSLDKILVAA